MASNINPYNVDGTFPIAGQDNSSQGFRDNFTNIQNNFAYAEAEISDLQSKAITTSALTGQTLVNDMAGTQIRRPQLTAWTQSLLDVGTVSGTASLNFNSANFQKITTAAPITLSFINWPTSTGSGALGYGVMRVWIVVTNTSHTVTLPSSVNIAVGDIAGYNPNTNIITFDSTGNYIFDFSSIDGGTDYQIFDVTRNRSSLRDPQIYFNPAVTTAPTLFLGYGQNGAGNTGLNIALASDQGQNIVSAQGSYNSVAVGNLSFANVTNATLDTTKIGGYTITAARGNLTTATIQPVQSGDYLGYHNAVAYTGQGGSANVFQQLSSIVYYATGSNVAYGLGGNIAFFTADDGGNTGNIVLQAVGIENNQMFKTFAGIAEVGTYVVVLPTGGGSFTANSSISTLIIDSSLEATIAYANITLPSNPVNGQRIKISSVAPITNANINAPSMAAIKYVPTSKFSSGNIAVSLTYISATSTWYVA
jgi:hypothetical protein